MILPDYTKEQVFAALVAYIDHVSSCEGISFLSPNWISYVPAEHREILLLAGSVT